MAATAPRRHGPASCHAESDDTSTTGIEQAAERRSLTAPGINMKEERTARLPRAQNGAPPTGVYGARAAVPKSLDRTTFSMTIAHIKSNALRRTLLVLIVPLLPLLIAGAAALVALCAFADAFIGEFRGGFWRSVRDCWKSAR